MTDYMRLIVERDGYRAKAKATYNPSGGYWTCEIEGYSPNRPDFERLPMAVHALNHLLVLVDKDIRNQGQHATFIAGPYASDRHARPLATPTFDLIAHLHRQKTFSQNAFGPGERTKGVTDHIEKELAEVRAKPDDISEWVDLVLLALDGAWRMGFSPEQIAEAITAKQTKNENRTWPDWRTADPDKAIEHDRRTDA
ncbi:MAG: dATP/dGTP pyrophosphohydrolase domain-containing protein [Pseudomonadota bacterium]